MTDVELDELAQNTAHYSHQPVVVERCVVVARQPDGFGLTVTGDHPVYVDTVKPDGAAYLAGVREGDRILKVNGMPVSSSNHLEVIRMISAGSNVVLTLFGKPLEPICITEQDVHEYKTMSFGSRDSSFEECDREERKFRKLKELHQMLQQERRNLEDLCGSSDRQSVKSEKVRQKIRDLQSQLLSIDPAFNGHLGQIDPDRASPVRSWVDSGGMHYIQAADVIPMEDESDDEDELAPMESHGPFSNLPELKSRPAHLAAFLNYLLNNANPSSLLFYLITDAYQASSCPVKDMRRFAYEIFSTFVIPSAPLEVPDISQPIIHAIDKVLRASTTPTSNDMDVLKKLFIQSRSRALGDINDSLADFRQKRQIGMGGTFDAAQIDNIAKGDHSTEYRVAEQMMMKMLEDVYHSANSDLENCEPRLLALAVSIASVIKVVLGMKPTHAPWDKLLEKCPIFLAREKSSMFKKPVIGKGTVRIKEHQFVQNPVNLTVHCYQCRGVVWGVNAQAYFCQNCDVVVHKQCSTRLADQCYPVTQQKSNKASSSKLRARSAGVSSASSASLNITARHETHSSPDTRSVGHEPLLRTSIIPSMDAPPPPPPSSAPPTRLGHGHVDLPPERPDYPTAPPPPIPPPVPAGPSVPENVKSASSDSGIGAEMDRPISRSQSMKSEAVHQVKRPGRTPNSFGEGEKNRMRTMVEDNAYEQPIPSSSRVVPTNVVEVQPSLVKVSDVSSVAGSSSMSRTSTNEEEARRMMEKVERTALAEGDSDLELDTEVPSIEAQVSWEVIKRLKPKEKRRQEAINELFYTERTHVRNLKILYKVFYKPLIMQRVMSPDVINLLFGNLDEVLEVHTDMRHQMQVALDVWRADASLEGLYGDIGELMEGMFGGILGERLMKATAEFCQHQQHSLDILRQRSTRSKDDPLSVFLAEAESNPLCRKLQLKDIIPVEMQRLVKYPLLLETIAKYTAEPSKEQERLMKAVIAAKKLLSTVNTSKRNAENKRRLEELQGRLELNTSDKATGQESFFQSFEFTQHRLIHDGALIWRQSRGKTIDLHVVLLEHLLVFLTKGNDGTKLYLRVHESGCIPVMKLSSVMVKEKPNDKRAFNLFYSSDILLYELVAATATEKKTWMRLIEEQVSLLRQESGGTDLSDFKPPPVATPKLRTAQVSEEGATAVAKVERVHVLTHPRLVSANEITIQQPTILEHAEPVLTPAERLRRSDKLIITSLAEKNKILAEYLPETQKGNEDLVRQVTEALNGMSVAELRQRSSMETAISALVIGNRLIDSINKQMTAKKEDNSDNLVVETHESHLPSVPCYKLTAVAAPLLNHLRALLQVIKDQDSEISTLRQELNKCKDLTVPGPGDRTVSEETLTE